MTAGVAAALGWFLGGSAKSGFGAKEWGAPTVVSPGPVGLCRRNAREYAGQDPDRFAYAEGVVWLPTGYAELHGWVIDRTTNSAVETTERYAGATRYRGLIFDVRAVERFLDWGRDRRADFYLNGALYSSASGVVDTLFSEFWDGEWSKRDMFRILRQTLTDNAVGG